MRLPIIISTFIILSFHGFSQEYCSKTSVYFDANKSELTGKSINTLDSLVKILNQQSYLLELYAFADSSASIEYNLKLSATRNETVRNYINTKTNQKLRFSEKNLGESENGNNTDNMALYRRVDIYVVPLVDDRILISKGRENVDLPLDYFEPCGVCASRPKLKSYYSRDEGEKDNILFENEFGGRLITAGTMKLDFIPCNNDTVPNTKCINYTIPAEKYDPDMRIWEKVIYKNGFVWRQTDGMPFYDSVQKVYRFSACDVMINLDKPWWCWNKEEKDSKIIYPKVFQPLKSKILNGKKVIIQSSFDSIPINGSVSTTATTVSIGKIKNNYYFLNSPLAPFETEVDSNFQTYNVYHTYRIPLSAYKTFRFSDTTIIFKYKKKAKVENIGYFIMEVEDYLPIVENLPEGSLVSKKPLEGNLVAIRRKDKVYIADLDNLNFRYKKKKNTYKIKLNNANLNKFSYYAEMEPERK